MKTPKFIYSILIITSIVSFLPFASAQGNKYSCLHGYVLCSIEPVNVRTLSIDKNPGNTSMPCFPSSTGYNEVTFYWSMAEAAELEFDILPVDPNDDLDFILYKLDLSGLQCEKWNSIRCMSTGPNLANVGAWSPCSGLTGLTADALGTETLYGCHPTSSNYLASVQAQQGELFALKVMNFSSYQGFTMIFRNKTSFVSSEFFPLETKSLSNDDLQIISSDGCIKKIGTGLTTSTDETITSDFSIFPNPASTQLNVVTNKLQINLYRIIDHTGKTMEFENIGGLSTFSVALGSISNGIYLLELTDLAGNTYAKQFIKM